MSPLLFYLIATTFATMGGIVVATVLSMVGVVGGITAGAVGTAVLLIGLDCVMIFGMEWGDTSV